MVADRHTLVRSGGLIFTCLALGAMAYSRIHSGQPWPILIVFAVPLTQMVVSLGAMNFALREWRWMQDHGWKTRSTPPPWSITLAYLIVSVGSVFFAFFAFVLPSLPLAIIFGVLVCFAGFTPVLAAGRPPASPRPT